MDKQRLVPHTHTDRLSFDRRSRTECRSVEIPKDRQEQTAIRHRTATGKVEKSTYTCPLRPAAVDVTQLLGGSWLAGDRLAISVRGRADRRQLELPLCRDVLRRSPVERRKFSRFTVRITVFMDRVVGVGATDNLWILNAKL